MTTNRNVMVIEDNEENGELVRLHLRDFGCDVTWMKDGISGLNMVKSGNFNLIILDLMLPDMNGLEICRILRKKGDQTPIMILSAKCSDVEKVMGLESGADDYLTKPFNSHELLARVKALLRRYESFSMKSSEERDIKNYGNLRLDTSNREVYLNSEPVDLTAVEFDLLEKLSTNYGRVMTRQQLLDRVWGCDNSGFGHTIDSHIHRLRRKIEVDPSNPEHILTVWGIGYKFNGI